MPLSLSYLIYWCCLSDSHNILEICITAGREEIYVQEKPGVDIRLT